MASNLTYAPTAILESGTVDFEQAALALARTLLDKELPSMLISRDQSDDLERAGRISDTILKRGILPVVEFYTTDRSDQLRNLHDSAVLGTLDLHWKDGEPAFEIADLLEFLIETWKTRIPIDFNLHFHGTAPTFISVENIARMVRSVMERNQHVQVVKLSGIPENQSDENLEFYREMWNLMLNACPGSEPALSPALWAEYSMLRTGVHDLGVISFECDNSNDCGSMTIDLKRAEKAAIEVGYPIAPRLPLTISFYKQSWFAIDVGKVLTMWTERKAFKPYSERPRPQA